MIRGVVNARCAAIVQLTIRGADGIEVDVDAVVDTGFTASLTLPASVASSMNLVQQSVAGAILADGSVRQLDIFEAEINWEDEWRPILVTVVGNEVLLGMRLLEDHELRIEAVPGGVVEIFPLP